MTNAVPAHGRLAALGRWCAAHPWPIVVLWLAVLAGATVANNIVGGTFSDDFSLSNTESGAGSSALAAHGVAAGANSSRIVFHTNGQLSAQHTTIENSVDQLRHVAHVQSVSDPFGAGTVSTNGQVAYATIRFDSNPVNLGDTLIDSVGHATDSVRSTGINVDYTGNLGKAAEPATGDLRSELIGIIIAIVVLLIAFGSVLAAGLPILTSIVGVATALAGLGLIASQITFATASPTLAIMIGLGVGIDYAVFLTTRHRQQLMNGADPVTAAGATTASSGRSVLVAASTVVIALLGLFAVRVSFIGKLGLAASIAVVIAAIAAVTLVPAMLGLAGTPDRPAAGAPPGCRGVRRRLDRCVGPLRASTGTASVALPVRRGSCRADPGHSHAVAATRARRRGRGPAGQHHPRGLRRLEFRLRCRRERPVHGGRPAAGDG